MKKIISMVLAVGLLCSCLAGCGNKTASTVGGVETIHVWSNDGGGKALWDQLVNDYNATTGKEKGIKIVLTTYGTDYGTIVDVSRQANQLPEILAGGYGQAKKLEYIKTGDIIAIDDIEGGKEFLEKQNFQKINGSNLIDGKIYNVYTEVTVPGLLYNKDLFKKAGIVDENGEAKPPKTIAEAREYAKIITNTKDGIYGYAFPMKFNWDYLLGVTFVASTGGNVKYDYDNLTVDFSGWKKPLEWLLALKNDGSLFPGSEGLDNDTVRAYFAEGKIGMMAGMSWDVGVLTSQFVADCDWGVAPFPLIDENNKYPVWNSLGGSYTLSKTALSANQKKVMEVFRFLHSPETRVALYENNMKLSCQKKVMDMVDESKVIPQFKAFAELYDENYKTKLTPPLKIEGDSSDRLFEKVFAGQLTVDDAIADLNTRYTAALKKGVANGDLDLSLYK